MIMLHAKLIIKLVLGKLLYFSCDMIYIYIQGNFIILTNINKVKLAINLMLYVSFEIIYIYIQN